MLAGLEAVQLQELILVAKLGSSLAQIGTIGYWVTRTCTSKLDGKVVQRPGP